MGFYVAQTAIQTASRAAKSWKPSLSLCPLWCAGGTGTVVCHLQEEGTELDAEMTARKRRALRALDIDPRPPD